MKRRRADAWLQTWVTGPSCFLCHVTPEFSNTLLLSLSQRVLGFFLIHNQESFLIQPNWFISPRNQSSYLFFICSGTYSFMPHRDRIFRKQVSRTLFYSRQEILILYFGFWYLWVMIYASDHLLHWLEFGKCNMKTTTNLFKWWKSEH